MIASAEGSLVKHRRAFVMRDFLHVKTTAVGRGGRAHGYSKFKRGILNGDGKSNWMSVSTGGNERWATRISKTGDKWAENQSKK